MEKLSIVSNFNKTIDLLRSTEYSSKDKVAHFHHIADCILSPSMRQNVNYSKHISTALNILLFFCEDMDSSSMSAEESLNKIIRCLETDKLSRVMVDLYSEIKKNGNQKSLRICLNLFAFYSPRIKEKNVKWYGLKLVACLEMIAKRNEPQLMETLSEFMKCFGQHIQVCLNDNETYKLLQVFLLGIKSDCAIKRRCAAQNCITLIEYSKNKKLLAKNCLSNALDLIMENQETSTILGVLGFLRLLLALIASENIFDCNKQILELYELCLCFLNEETVGSSTNHSMINASLEVINSILSQQNQQIHEILTSERLQHNEILKKRKSLKNQIFQMKYSGGLTCIASGLATESNKEETFGMEGMLDDASNKHHLGRISSNVEAVSAAATPVKPNELEEYPCKSNEMSVGEEKKTVNVIPNSCAIPSKYDGGFMLNDKSNAMSEFKPDLEFLQEMGEATLGGHLDMENTESKSMHLSDIDNESFNSVIDFDSEIMIGEREDDERQVELKKKGSTNQLKTQKSTESFGSFFNNILSHSNTETMTKLFRPSTAKLSSAVTTTPTMTTNTVADSSTTSTPKTKQGFISYERLTSAELREWGEGTSASGILPESLVSTAGGRLLTIEDDTISLESINSHISLGSSSHVSLKNDQDLVVLVRDDGKFEINQQEKGNDTSHEATISKYDILKDSNTSSIAAGQQSENYQQDLAGNITVDIGTVYEQNLIHYTARLISSKFLLNGKPNGLFSDSVVRVSIKNLSLNVLAQCVRLKPEILRLSLQIDREKQRADTILVCEGVPKIHDEMEEADDGDDDDNSSNEIRNEFDMGDQFDDYGKNFTAADCLKECSQRKSFLKDDFLEIKDNHFGESTTNYFDYDLPTCLSKSADYSLLDPFGKINKSQGNEKFDNQESKNRFNKIDDRILSKSEIIETKLSARSPLSGYKKNDQKKIPNKTIEWVSVENVGKLQVQSKLLNVQKLSERLEFESNAETNVLAENDGKQQQKQYLYDILLFHNHSDPILRGDVQIIVGNFIAKGLHSMPIPILHRRTENFDDDWPRQLDINMTFLPLLIKGLQDDIHTVVIHALSTFDKTFSLLMANYFEPRAFVKKSAFMNKLYDPSTPENDDDDDDDDVDVVSIQKLLEVSFTTSTNRHEKLIENKEIGKYGRGHEDIAADNSETVDKKTKSHRKVRNTWVITPRVLLNQLQHCYDNNKYWLVQNKYAGVVSNLNFATIQKYYGNDVANTYENVFLLQLFRLLGDNDFRVREHAAECLCHFVRNGSEICETTGHITAEPFDMNFMLVDAFLKSRIFPGSSISRILFERKILNVKNSRVEKALSKVLYHLTNLFLEINDKNLQFGAATAIKQLLKTFNPIDYNSLWIEFSLADVCLKFAYQNYALAIDLTGQCDLLEIIIKLLTANILCARNINGSDVDALLSHTLKILNIYSHLFGNQKPLIASKTPRITGSTINSPHILPNTIGGSTNDIFLNAKELAIINSFGYFSGEYFYVRLYRILKASYETYKMSINETVGVKFLNLLNTCLQTLTTLLELKATSTINESVKIVEEIIQYLTTLVNYSPEDSIKCLRQLLKFLFGRNYGNRKYDYENLIKLYSGARRDSIASNDKNQDSEGNERIANNRPQNIARVENSETGEHSRAFHQHPYRQHRSQRQSDNRNPRSIVSGIFGHSLAKLFASAMNFPLGKSQREEECAKHIKLFEPLVIYCLTLFMKSNALVQEPILELLSQLLEFNVTYSILDSQNVIFEQVLRNLELIESGISRNSSILVPAIIKFLCHLTKQSDRNLITIPKIISITNGLLANNSIKECGILALNELAFEVFFQQPPTQEGINDKSSETTSSHRNQSQQSPSTTALNAKEIKTQKEVVLRMLEKFINSLECQQMLSVLLLWDKTKAIETDSVSASKAGRPDNETDPFLSFFALQPFCAQEGEIFSIVIKGLEDERIEVLDCNSFYVLDSLFKNGEKSYLQDSGQFQALLSMFMKKNLNNFNNLSQTIIILENAILKPEEIYLENHIKLYMERNCEKFSKAPTNDSINYFAKVLYDKLQVCLTILKGSLSCSTSYLPSGIKHDFDKKLYQTSSYVMVSPLNGKELKLLAIKFIRTLNLLEKFDSIKIALRNKMLKDEFYSKHDVAGLSFDHRLQLEILRLLCKLNFDKIFLLQCVAGIRRKLVQREAILEIFEIYSDVIEWNIEDVHVLVSDEVFRTVSRDKETLMSCCFLLRNPQFAEQILAALFQYCKLAPKVEAGIIVDFIEKLTSCSSITKIKILLELFENKLIGKLLHTKISSKIKEFFNSSTELTNFDKEIIFYLKKFQGRTDFPVLTDDMKKTFKISQNVFDLKTVMHRNVDEEWLSDMVLNLSEDFQNSLHIVKILYEFKSESKLKNIFNNPKFKGIFYLRPCFDYCFKNMLESFQSDCVHINPHINYMKIHPLLKVSLRFLQTSIEASLQSHFDEIRNSLDLANAISSLMMNTRSVEVIGLALIEDKFLEKFITENFFGNSNQFAESLIKFLVKISTENLRKYAKNNCKSYMELRVLYGCIDEVLKQKIIWQEFNQPEKYGAELNTILETVYENLMKLVRNTSFYEECCMEPSRSSISIKDEGNKKIENNAALSAIEEANDSQAGAIEHKVILIAKLLEAKSFSSKDTKSMSTMTVVNGKYEDCEDSFSSLMKILKSIAVSLLRINSFYSLAVTPFELFESLNDNANGNSKLSSGWKLAAIPVENLSDAEILQKFVKRFAIFGFNTRQQFEECLMTFLLLINQDYDENMVDQQEQFQIRNICLAAIIELLINCKSFPMVGNPLSKCMHFPRWTRVGYDTISTKKLHKVQSFIPGSNLFYLPNVERILSVGQWFEDSVCQLDGDNIIGTNYFLPNQFELNYIWRQIEGQSSAANIKEDACLKNARHFTKVSEIDLKSSCQLIFDIFTQLIEQNHNLVLPHLMKFCEICDNQEHIRWMRNTMLRLYETIPMDDTISHQYIIYLLCRTQSILIPSIGELTHLCSIVSTYLKSSHIFIRIATLYGLLSLLECCSKTNTAIGKLSEELSVIRSIICGYIMRHGIIEESSVGFSDVHTKLVWTLNFSLIEMTTKFVPECSLLANTIISANNLLKRTSNEGVYLCIVHGLERVLVSNSNISKSICDKIEKLAIELVKLENERYSIAALKLLSSCVYIGSSKQLENTEHANGIVQDDPEIIVQQTEKVDVLLQRIKSSTSSAAKIYGKVLCQIIRDLVPPNEILTKVIKEFLTINQKSHCEVIATIVYQVFRSAIDSSFLNMLQDWLICSLPSFLQLPQERAAWSLTVIFLSASINLHLIKLFPFVLNEFKNFKDDTELLVFVTSARDFYSKLNADQKHRFKAIFSVVSKETNQGNVFIKMLECL